MKHKITVYFIVLLLSTTLWAYAASPVSVGVSLGLTGKYRKMGQMQEKGFRLWAEQVNKRGGLLGRPIKLIVYDDKSDKATAKRLYEKLLSEDKVDLLFTPYSSSLTAAVAPIIEKHRFPTLVSGASSDKIWEKGYRNLFGVYIPASRYAVGFLEMSAMKGYSKIAIVHADDAFSKLIGEGTRTWALNFGLQLVYFKQFNKGKTDFDNLASNAQQFNPEIIIMCGHFNEAVGMRTALKKLNWIPKAYFASVGPSLPAYGEKLGKDADRSFSSSQWEPSVAYNPYDKTIFLSPFKQRYGIDPAYQAATAYAAGQILEKAVLKANSFDRNKIRNTLSEMYAMSIIGRYGVDNTGKQIKHFPLIIQWQEGQKHIVWPSDLATKEPILE
jgi:branched-chain amino acid transport system substrate-binding protein